MKTFTKKKSTILVAIVLLLGLLTQASAAEYRKIHFYYINGMSTTIDDAKIERKNFAALFSGYNPELIYSKTGGRTLDAATIVSFQNKIRECTSWLNYIKDNCAQKDYLKKVIGRYTGLGEAVHIVSYSRGNILANVATEEVEEGFTGSDGYYYYANMNLLGRVNIASPGRLKYGNKFTTKKTDRVIRKVSKIIKGAKGNYDSRLAEIIYNNYPSLSDYIGKGWFNEHFYNGNTNGHSLTTYLHPYGLKSKIQDQVIEDYLRLRDKSWIYLED